MRVMSVFVILLMCSFTTPICDNFINVVQSTGIWLALTNADISVLVGADDLR